MGEEPTDEKSVKREWLLSYSDVVVSTVKHWLRKKYDGNGNQDDIIQEAFIDLHSKYDLLRDEHEPRIRREVRKVVNRMKKKEYRKSQQTRQFSNFDNDAHGACNSAIELVDNLDEVAALLDRLSGKNRAIVERVLADKSVAVIASELGIKPSTVYRRLKKICKRFSPS